MARSRGTDTLASLSEQTSVGGGIFNLGTRLRRQKLSASFDKKVNGSYSVSSFPETARRLGSSASARMCRSTSVVTSFEP